jgi:mRNA interferase RelE/StbE
MYSVRLTSEAQEFYATADLPLAKKIARSLEVLEQTPSYHPNIKALKGNFAGYYRYRVGDYRVVYYITDELEPVVTVTIIAHRSQVYE